MGGGTIDHMGAHHREATLQVPAAPQSAGSARRFVQAQLDDWGLEVDGDGVVLMVSELVTNAGLHANSDATVRLVDQGDCLRVEVTDASTTPVEVRSHRTGAETGRGLRIVDALAARWGVDALPGGKTVWFEVVVQPERAGRRG